MDPLGGVVLFSANNTQDGTAYFDTVCFGTNVWKSKPDTVIFTSVGSALYLFVPQELTSLNNNINGHYDVTVNGTHYTMGLSNVIFLDPLVTSVKYSKDNNPTEFGISQNYPNPFNPSTTINYQLAVSENVTIKIFDITGKLVRTLLNQRNSVGYHSITWNGNNDDGKSVSSGTYLYQIRIANSVQTKRMLFLK